MIDIKRWIKCIDKERDKVENKYFLCKSQIFSSSLVSNVWIYLYIQKKNYIKELPLEKKNKTQFCFQ